MADPLEPSFRPAYHQLHRVGRPGAWRSILGAVTLLALVFVLVPAIVGLVVLLVLVAGGRTFEEAATALDITQEVTPAGLAVLNLVLAAGIVLAWLVSWLFHRLKPRWLTSVAPRMRWGYFCACLGLSVIALMASLGVALLLPVAPGGESPIEGLNEFTSRTADFLLVIALLTPLQAAGEEYVFRGYLTQAFGSIVAGRAISQALAVLGPAVLFALAHGLGQSWPVFFDRFAFGVVAGILVILTGGLEAPIAMHVLNNFMAFGLALAFGDMTEALNATGPSSWWMIASTLTQSLVYLGLAVWVARAMGLDDRGPAVGAVLEAPRSRV